MLPALKGSWDSPRPSQSDPEWLSMRLGTGKGHSMPKVLALRERDRRD